MQSEHTNIAHAYSNETFSNNLVSVVMPMHNSAAFLREAICSVLAQTYKQWELIIVEDASSDDSLSIAKKYERVDDRIRVLVNENPIGIPSAPRNMAIKAAKGRYIAFLDSDDIWFHQKLEQQLPLFTDSRVAIVFSNYEKMEEDGTRSNRIVAAPEHATYNSLLKGNVIGNLTSVYDRAKVGTVMMPDKGHEDYVMWLNILKKGYLARNTGTVLGAYRLHDSSVSSQKLKTAKWQWDIYRDIEHLSLFRSVYCFCHYAYKAFVKRLI